MSDTALTAEDSAALADMQAGDSTPWTDEQQARPAPREGKLEDAPAPEPSEPAAVETKEPTETPEAERQVSYGALKEERERRRRLETEHAAEKARIQERLDLMLQAMQARQAPSEPQRQASPEVIGPAPDPNADPMGYVKYEFDAQKREIAEFKAFREQQAAQSVQQQQIQARQHQIQEMAMWATGQESEYRKETPDYNEAANFLQTSRAKQYEMMGVTNPAEVQNAIAQDTINIAALARQRGQNFAETVYNLAKSVGYTKPIQAPAAVATQTVAAPVAPTVEADALARATRGAAMSATVGTGSAPRGELTADALGKMSDAEFAKVLDKMPRGELAQYMGR